MLIKNYINNQHKRFQILQNFSYRISQLALKSSQEFNNKIKNEILNENKIKNFRLWQIRTIPSLTNNEVPAEVTKLFKEPELALAPNINEYALLN